LCSFGQYVLICDQTDNKTNTSYVGTNRKKNFFLADHSERWFDPNQKPLISIQL